MSRLGDGLGVATDPELGAFPSGQSRTLQQPSRAESEYIYLSQHVQDQYLHTFVRSLSKTIDAEVDGEMAVLKEAINDMVYKLRLFSSEVTRVSLDVGTHGKLGGQAVVTGVEGTWRTRKATFPVSAFPRTCTDVAIRRRSHGDGEYHGTAAYDSDPVRSLRAGIPCCSLMPLPAAPSPS